MSVIEEVSAMYDETYLRKTLRWLDKLNDPPAVALFVKSKDTGVLHKFVVERQERLAYFIYHSRKHLNVKPYQSVTLIFQRGAKSDIIVPPLMSMGEVSDTYSHTDGFLYAVSASENAFG